MYNLLFKGLKPLIFLPSLPFLPPSLPPPLPSPPPPPLAFSPSPSPGWSTPQVAKQLAKLGVDVIEAGFPIASTGDFDAVRRIAESVGNMENPPIICGLARALRKDIETCWNAVKYAAFPRIHTFIATSDIHMLHKLKKSREEVRVRPGGGGGGGGF